MVRHGEYLERAVIIPSGSEVLEGLYHRGRGRRPVLIVPPHPEAGGAMESPVVAELAWALTRAGHATLRFNHRGVGASPGVFEPGPAQVDDAHAAAEHLLASTGDGATPLLVVALGGGGVVAAALAARVHVARLIVVSPPDAEFASARPPDLDTVAIVAGPAPDALARALEGRPGVRLEALEDAGPGFSRGLVALGTLVVVHLQGPGRGAR